jgi:hypothetical protein
MSRAFFFLLVVLAMNFWMLLIDYIEPSTVHMPEVKDVLCHSSVGESAYLSLAAYSRLLLFSKNAKNPSVKSPKLL